jgi:hypothetical protein
VNGLVMVWDPATGLNIGPSMAIPCVEVDVKFNPDSTLIALAHQRLFHWWTLDKCQKYLHTQTCPPAS